MINLTAVANGEEKIEDCLSRYGMTCGNYAVFVNQAVKNIRFLLTMDFITQEEGQACFNRVIAKMGQHLREV